MPAAVHPERPINVTVRTTADSAPLTEPVPTPAFQVKAMRSLLMSRADVPNLLRLRDYVRQHPRDIRRPRPAELLDAAEDLYLCALKCRQARWDDGPPYRLGASVFPDCMTADPGSRWDGSTLLGRMFRGHEALLVGAADGSAITSDGAPDVLEKLTGFVPLLYAYPNISPRTEAESAEDGYTAAEYLLDVAGAILAEIADEFRAFGEAGIGEYGAIAADVVVVVAAARRTIKDGVMHTLNGRHIMLDVAEEQT